MLQNHPDSVPLRTKYAQDYNVYSFMEGHIYQYSLLNTK